MSFYNPNNRNPAYQCGALLSIYEKLQCLAHPKVKVTVMQLYFNQARMNPSLVFGRLKRLSARHLRELEAIDPELSKYYAKLIADTYKTIDDTIPGLLTLPDQARFSQGFSDMYARFLEEEAAGGDPPGLKRSSQ